MKICKLKELKDIFILNIKNLINQNNCEHVINNRQSELFVKRKDYIICFSPSPLSSCSFVDTLIMLYVCGV